MKKTNDLKIGTIVQLSPETCKNEMFKGCFMVVSEIKDFGAQGYVQSLGENGEMGGQAYYRAKWSEMEICGKVHWIIGGSEDKL